MNEGRRNRKSPVRLMAAVVIAAAVFLCFSLQISFGQISAEPVFVVVMTVCGAVVILTRDLGARVGLGVGSTIGLVASTGLALHFPAPVSGLAAFVAVSTGILGALGYLAGGSHTLRFARRADQPPETGGLGRLSAAPHARDAAASSETAGDAAVGTRGGVWTDEALSAFAADFSEWAESDAGRQCYTDSGDWSGFDQFVRVILRERTGATGVRAYEVSADGEWLEPLTRGRAVPGGRLSARSGLIGRVVASGSVQVNDESACEPVNEEERTDERSADAPPFDYDSAAVADDGDQAVPGPSWAWLLPIQTAKRTVALVAVRQIDRSECLDPAVATAVRDQLQLFWGHLCALRSVWRSVRTDHQSGMLERTELLHRVDEIALTAADGGEPLMVMALAVEGLRRLDDTGRWSERDMLVERLGQVLRHKVRTGDVLGRFSDDRFVVVLRRIEAGLGTMVAEKLMQTIQVTVLDVLCPMLGAERRLDDTVRLRLRAGLAGTGWSPGGRVPRPFATFDQASVSDSIEGSAGAGARDGKGLLRRALALLDYARQQRIEIATDLMKGLPERLARDFGNCPAGAAEADCQPSAGETSVADAGNDEAVPRADETPR